MRKNDALSQISFNLEKIRIVRKISLLKIAQRAGLSYQTVCKYFRNVNDGMRISCLFDICEVLGCEPADVFAVNLDVTKYSIEADVMNFYPYNLALHMLEDYEMVYRVYVPELLRCIDKLTEKEKKVLCLRYKNDMTLENVGCMFDLSKERVRQIEARAFHKLKSQSLKKMWLYEERPESYCSSDDYLKKEIEYMELSVRTNNCLRRAGIKHIGDLCDLTVEDLKKVRNLGNKSLNELLDKASVLGIEIKKNKENKENMDKKLNQLGLEPATYNALTELGCSTLSDLNKITYYDIAHTKSGANFFSDIMKDIAKHKIYKRMAVNR